MTNNFVQLTYFFYATEVFRLVFPPFFVVLILLAGAKMLFVFFFCRNLIHANPQTTAFKKMKSKLQRILDESLLSQNKRHQKCMQARERQQVSF